MYLYVPHEIHIRYVFFWTFFEFLFAVGGWIDGWIGCVKKKVGLLVNLNKTTFYNSNTAIYVHFERLETFSHLVSLSTSENGVVCETEFFKAIRANRVVGILNQTNYYLFRHPRRCTLRPHTEIRKSSEKSQSNAHSHCMHTKKVTSHTKMYKKNQRVDLLCLQCAVVCV